MLIVPLRLRDWLRLLIVGLFRRELPMGWRQYQLGLQRAEASSRNRETMRVVAAICLGSVVAGFMVAAIIALVSARMP